MPPASSSSSDLSSSQDLSPSTWTTWTREIETLKLMACEFNIPHPFLSSFSLLSLQRPQLSSSRLAVEPLAKRTVASARSSKAQQIVVNRSSTSRGDSFRVRPSLSTSPSTPSPSEIFRLPTRVLKPRIRRGRTLDMVSNRFLSSFSLAFLAQTNSTVPSFLPFFLGHQARSVPPLLVLVLSRSLADYFPFPLADTTASLSPLA